MLPARTILGRSRSCTLNLNDPCVSSEHASIRWTREGWTIHDLGSRNGTFVSGRRLDSGDTAPLSRGETVAFGDPEEHWIVEDDSMPEACARDCNSNMLLFGQQGLLVLPEPQRPLVSIFCDPRLGWVAEVRGEPRVVEDGHILAEAGMAWQLHLPMMSETTQEYLRGQVFLDLLHIDFRVLKGGELTQMFVHSPKGEIFRSSRAYTHLLLSLARRRVEDRAKPNMPLDEQGWMFVDELRNLHGVDDNRLSVDIHRARREFASANIMNAANIIERRRLTRQVRIGISQIEVHEQVGMNPRPSDNPDQRSL